MNFLEKIRYNLNLTKNEIRIITFLIISLIIGATIKIIKSTNYNIAAYNYSKSDSTFFMLSNSEIQNINELSDKQTSQLKKKKLTEKSININQATKSELILLPGIGEVLAENIIKYREEKGKFDSISELLKVKGIGKKKFEKIKPYIFIE